MDSIKVKGKTLKVAPISLVYKPNYTAAEKNKAKKLTTKWKGQEQRSPFVTVDIVLLHKIGGEWHVLLGWWEKVFPIDGKPKRIAGVTVIPGGHFEKSGARDPKITKEGGDLNLISAAKKELHEETNISPTKLKDLTPLAVIDRVENDIRAHVLRTVFVATTTGIPKPSEEIKKFYHVPLRDLKRDVKTGYLKYNKQKLPFVLGHDEMLQTVFQLPAFNDYVNSH